jgi:hypothetical protein
MNNVGGLLAELGVLGLSLNKFTIFPPGLQSCHRDGEFAGYGVKFWPREIDKFVETKENFRWFREVYK